MSRIRLLTSREEVQKEEATFPQIGRRVCLLLNCKATEAKYAIRRAPKDEKYAVAIKHLPVTSPGLLKSYDNHASFSTSVRVWNSGLSKDDQKVAKTVASLWLDTTSHSKKDAVVETIKCLKNVLCVRYRFATLYIEKWVDEYLQEFQVEGQSDLTLFLTPVAIERTIRRKVSTVTVFYRRQVQREVENKIQNQGYLQLCGTVPSRWDGGHDTARSARRTVLRRFSTILTLPHRDLPHRDVIESHHYLIRYTANSVFGAIQDAIWEQCMLRARRTRGGDPPLRGERGFPPNIGIKSPGPPPPGRFPSLPGLPCDAVDWDWNLKWTTIQTTGTQEPARFVLLEPIPISISTHVVDEPMGDYYRCDVCITLSMPLVWKLPFE